MSTRPTLILALFLIFLSVVCGGLGGVPRETECCKAESVTWRIYDRENNLHGLCDAGYHLPEDAFSSDATIAARCLSKNQIRKIQIPSNGYFLPTEASLSNCYKLTTDPTECNKFIMICVKDGCYEDTEVPTTQPPSGFDCTQEPVLFTNSLNTNRSTQSPLTYSNWQSSFPVRMGITTGNSPLIGQIKLFWTPDPDDIPSDIIPCNGSPVDAAEYPLLHYMFTLDPNYDYNGVLFNCEDRVIIRYSDEDNIPFASIGGTDQLPTFDVAHDVDVAIAFDETQCPFDRVHYDDLVTRPESQSFDQMQPYLAANILIATDWVDTNDFEVGELVLFAGSDWMIPENGLIACDGSTHLISKFPILYNLISGSTPFDNGTHFSIPNCNGKALISTETFDNDGEFEGTVNNTNIPNYNSQSTIPLVSAAACTADIAITYDNECVDVNNVMPVFPALFVLDDVTNEFRLFITEIDTSNLVVTYVDGIAFASTQSLDELRGVDDISCDTLAYNHEHQYNLECDYHYTPTQAPLTRNPTVQPTPEPTPKPTGFPTEWPTSYPPSSQRTYGPTSDPTMEPTIQPTPHPTAFPSWNPTPDPTRIPTSNPTSIPTESPTFYPTDIPTPNPTGFPTEFPTSIPTKAPTPIPTAQPTKTPTKQPTEIPTVEPTVEPTIVPTTNPTSSPTPPPTPPLCEFKPSNSTAYEFAIVVDNSCGLTDDECQSQLLQIAELFLIIKVDNPPFRTKVSFIEYGADSAVIRVGLDDDQLQNNITAFYDYILHNVQCGGDGNGQTDLVSGINAALTEFSTNGNPNWGPSITTYRKIFTINNCQNNVQNTSTKVCDELYEELDTTFDNPIDRVVVNQPYAASSTNSITSPDEYLSCFVRPLLGSPTGFICGATDADYDFTLDIDCREEGICFHAQRTIPDPTSSPTKEPTSFPTKVPTETPTPDPTTSDPTLCTPSPTEYVSKTPWPTKQPELKTPSPTKPDVDESCCEKIADEIIDESDCTLSKKIYYEMYLKLFQCNKHCQSFDTTRSSSAAAAGDCFTNWAEYTQLYLLCKGYTQLADWSYYEINQDICFPCSRYKADDPKCGTSAPTIMQTTDHPTSDPTVAPSSSEPTTDPTRVPSVPPTLTPTTPTTAPTPPACYMEPGSFYVTRNTYELAFVVDNSCGLTDEECKVQLEQIGELFLTVKIDVPPNNITRITYIEYGASGASIRVGLNDDLQLDPAAFYDYIINNGGCGDGGNGQTDLVSGIDKALDEFINNGNSDEGTFRKIYIINNCINNAQDTDSEICDRLYHELEGSFKQQIDKAIINIPAPSDRANNTIGANADAYLNCFVRSNQFGQETGGICAATDDGQITRSDYYNLYLDDECREEFICGFTGRTRPDTEEPTPNPSPEPTPKPTPEPTPEPTMEPSLEPTLEPTLEPSQTPTRVPSSPPAFTLSPTTYPTTSIPTFEPSYIPTEMPIMNKTHHKCPPDATQWSEWGKWSACLMYRDPYDEEHFKHVRYRTRHCECDGYGKRNTCKGSHIELEECESDCVAIWTPWCPWSACIIQDFDCITDQSGNGVCNGFQFRTRACLKHLPNNDAWCDTNCTCEADQWGTDSRATRTCATSDCLQIVFENDGDDSCVPQWRVEVDDNDLTLRNLIIQQGGAVGDECIPVVSGQSYWLIVRKGCGTIKWFYRGQMLESYRFDSSVIVSDYRSKELKINIPTLTNRA
eukprot:543715_1